jgi:hypothetical protein
MHTSPPETHHHGRASTKIERLQEQFTPTGSFILCVKIEMFCLLACFYTLGKDTSEYPEKKEAIGSINATIAAHAVLAEVWKVDRSLSWALAWSD